MSAGGIRGLGGEMQGRLVPRHQVKEESAENRRLGEQESARCTGMGINAGERLTLEQMVSDDDVIFSATGITDGDLLKGITRKGNMATSETLLIRGKTGTIRRIQSIHRLDRKTLQP